MNDASIESAYNLAREQYAGLGVDTEQAMAALDGIAISMHAWQGDDVCGFEAPDAALTGGGIMTTGNYPGRARTPAELRSDIIKAMELIPGSHRVNLQAIHADTGGKRVERNEILPEHFASWIDCAKEHGLGLDFNGSFFSHPKSDDGFTLASRDEGIRKFWVEHGIASRRIGAAFGAALGAPCITNVWVPDGYKDMPADRLTPRMILKQSLDEIFAEELNPAHNRDAVESKLFGLGSESYVAGSHEFYLGYAVANKKLLCLDTGHFHPTEIISDKISAVMLYLDEIILHVSRGVRWDSDHVVILSDELRAIAAEIVRGGFLRRAHIGLDFFDASINRVAAWVIGMRNMMKALLIALLEPGDTLRELEAAGDFTGRLAMLEELKCLPFAAVWDAFCLRRETPVGRAWLDEVRAYEKGVLAERE